MSAFKQCLIRLLVVTGIARLVKYRTRKRPRFLMFHKVYETGQHDPYFDSLDEAQFESILVLLKKHFALYKVSDLMAYRNEHGAFPENACCVTFDDGFASFASKVMPLLQRYEIPATLFVCPELIDQSRTLWPEELFQGIEQGDITLSVQTARQMLPQLKAMPEREREQKLAELGLDRSTLSPAGDNRSLLDWAALKLLADSPLVEIGSHTLTHPILAQENDQDAERQIMHSKQRIEEVLQISVSSFCYPNGQLQDISQRDEQLVQKAGYRSALASHHALASEQDSVFRLPRIGGDFPDKWAAQKYLFGLDTLF